MTTETLLPPNATPEELALEQAILPGADVRSAVDLVRTSKENPPDDWLLFLIWEYGLEELLPYFSDRRELIREGIEWTRIKGTPASLIKALGWVGNDADVEQEEPGGAHWFEYQIDPGLVPNGTLQLDLIKQLAGISAPVGTRLSRIFHGYDVRRLKLDYGRLDDHLLSDYSGILDDDGVKLSFGRTIDSVTSVDAPVPTTSIEIDYARFDRYQDRALLDFMRIEDVSVVNYSSFIGTEVLRQTYTEVGPNWSGTGMTWNAPGGWSSSYASTSEQSRDYRVYDSFASYGAGWDTQATWAQVNSNWRDAGPQSYSAAERTEEGGFEPFYLFGRSSALVTLGSTVQAVSLVSGAEQVWIDNRGSTDVLVEFIDDPLDSNSFRVPAGSSFPLSVPFSDPLWDGKVRIKRPAGSASEQVLISSGVGA